MILSKQKGLTMIEVLLIVFAIEFIYAYYHPNKAPLENHEKTEQSETLNETSPNE